ncbi:MAG TPA: hypothetical protein VHK26_11195 [Methyloceanibacter sp.]|jgi:hypothetical protein|nr:hypothetical protein [Methyloceanibacter sp.]
MVFVIVMGGLALIQSERNHCYWHGIENWAEWVDCVGKIKW